MKSQADALQDRTVERVLALSLPERIALALALGDDDLALFVRTSGLDPATARETLRAQRRHGRLPSVSAGTVRTVTLLDRVVASLDAQGVQCALIGAAALAAAGVARSTYDFDLLTTDAAVLQSETWNEARK